MTSAKGPVIIYRLVGGRVSGDHLIFRRTKGGITENFGHGGWGVSKVIKCY